MLPHVSANERICALVEAVSSAELKPCPLTSATSAPKDPSGKHK